MSRLLAFQNLKRAAHFAHLNRTVLYGEGKKCGEVVINGLSSSQKRLQTGFHFRKHVSFIPYSVKRSYFNNYSVTSSNTMSAHHAQVNWRRLLLASPNGSSQSIRWVAQAFSLALNRSYVVVPAAFALTCGSFAVAQSSAEDCNPFHSKKTLYLRAEDGHAMFTSILFSVFEGIVLVFRAFCLAVLFSPCMVMAPFADSFGPRFRQAWLRVVLRTLETAGPAFIKWGQWAATRPDLFPRDLCAELARLQTNAPQHSFSYTKRSVEKAFGRTISEIFDDFEEVPVASGSIAQIHRATLKHGYRSGQMKPIVVAVKVRHPGVGESIRRDFNIINIVAKGSTFIPTLKWLRLDESVQQFAAFMLSQVDLSREAAHLSRFIYNFRRWRDVSFPKPVYPLVHPAVLVETFEQGESVSYYVDELEGHGRLKKALAHIGTHAFLKMLLVDNFIHADMHPGNILVRTQKKSSEKKLFKSKPHVVLLDVGMTAELSRHDRKNLIEFFKAVSTRDGETAAHSTLRLSKKQNCPNPEAFVKEVKETFDFWGTPEGDLVHPADCMHHLLEQVRRHKVNIDGNVCTVMVTMLVLEGWQRKLDPDYDVMHTLRTLFLKEDWAKSLTYTIEGLMAP